MSGPRQRGSVMGRRESQRRQAVIENASSEVGQTFARHAARAHAVVEQGLDVAQDRVTPTLRLGHDATQPLGRRRRWTWATTLPCHIYCSISCVTSAQGGASTQMAWPALRSYPDLIGAPIEPSGFCSMYSSSIFAKFNRMTSVGTTCSESWS